MKKLLLLIILFLFSGCLSKYKIAIPVYEQRPTVFDLYEFGGGYSYNKASHNYFYSCGFHFIYPITNKEDIDTLPILIVDSICFEHDCLAGKDCYIPIPKYLIGEKAKYKIDLNKLKIIDGTEDLEFINNQIVPTVYSLECGYYLPKDCQNYIVTSIVYASLHDRTTYELIAIDSAKIDLRFETTIKWYRSFGYSGPLCDSDLLNK